MPCDHLHICEYSKWNIRLNQVKIVAIMSHMALCSVIMIISIRDIATMTYVVFIIGIMSAIIDEPRFYLRNKYEQTSDYNYHPHVRQNVCKVSGSQICAFPNYGTKKNLQKSK